MYKNAAQDAQATGTSSEQAPEAEEPGAKSDEQENVVDAEFEEADKEADK